MNLEAQPARGSVPEPDAFVGAGAQLARDEEDARRALAADGASDERIAR